jgi:hypothetical protein
MASFTTRSRLPVGVETSAVQPQAGPGMTRAERGRKLDGGLLRSSRLHEGCEDASKPLPGPLPNQHVAAITVFQCFRHYDPIREKEDVSCRAKYHDCAALGRPRDDPTALFLLLAGLPNLRLGTIGPITQTSEIDVSSALGQARSLERCFVKRRPPLIAMESVIQTGTSISTAETSLLSDKY